MGLPFVLPPPSVWDGISDWRMTYIFYSFIKSASDQVTLLITREQNAWKKPFITLKGTACPNPFNMHTVWQEMLSTNANAISALMPDNLFTSISRADAKGRHMPGENPNKELDMNIKHYFQFHCTDTNYCNKKYSYIIQNWCYNLIVVKQWR